MSRKYIDSDDFDCSDFTYSDFYSDLKDAQSTRLKWLLEEFQIQFEEAETTKISNKEKFLLDLASKFAPYFIKCSNDENREVREFAKIGLDQIRKRFPNLIKENLPQKNQN
jgi:vacuolar-type H+-ATPase subunit B/Vma2